MKKNMAKKATAALLSLTLAATPFGTAFADDSAGSSEQAATSQRAVGCLTLVANYNEGEMFTDGHSFLMFTSYTDNLSLEFTDLYGYYVPSEGFAAAEKEDHSLASFTSNFRYVADKMGYTTLTEEAYKALSAEEQEAQYPGLKAAIDSLADESYILTLGAEREDTHYRRTSYTFTLNTGEYLTIGNYSMADTDTTAATEAFTRSTLKKKFIADLKDKMLDGHTPEEALDALAGFLADYADGKYTDDQVKETIEQYMLTVVTETVYKDIVLPYMMEVNFIDGDTTGGLFVNRELWRQKAWQTFNPDHVYSVDITQQQLNDLMAYLNGGDANHYSLAAHNCTTVAAEGWNAAVGYLRDESGNNMYDDKSPLYLNELDTTYDWLKGMVSTPKKAYEVMGQWISQNLGGTGGSMPIVRGVETRLVGDVNNSGALNIVDAQVTYDLSKGTYGADLSQFNLPTGWNTATLYTVADVNSSGAIDTADARAIQYAVHNGGVFAA